VLLLLLLLVYTLRLVHSTCNCEGLLCCADTVNGIRPCLLVAALSHGLELQAHLRELL
jgi:hypothetical protein